MRRAALGGGSIKDAHGNAAVLTLPACGTDGLATKNIVVQTAVPSGLPNLTPYKPAGWSDKIVVSKLAASCTDSSPWYASDNLTSVLP